ncbi:MAG: hypothetical protein ACREQ9_06480 [Candidatus Binatia bacterium]
MRTLVALAVSGWMLCGAATAAAEINCAQVNRYLQTGRSVQDVAETMVIAEEEVKKCQEEAKKAGGEQPAGGGSASTGETKQQ